MNLLTPIAVGLVCLVGSYFFIRAVAPPHEVGFFVGRRESARRHALWLIRLEYAGKVDQSLLDSVEHSPHSPEHVRQILDDHIKSTSEFEKLYAQWRSDAFAAMERKDDN